MSLLTLTKHHGLGNDFLVLLDLEDAHAADAASIARALCDRRRGIGADGFIRASRGPNGADASMELHNADGGRAEMSGNGIRCLAQALVDCGVHGGPELVIATDAGNRDVLVHPEYRRGERDVVVDMGAATIEELGSDRARVSTGNPHLVLRTEALDSVDIAELGRANPDVNVEVIAVHNSEIDMRVHERGVGVTQACGTGSCASAVAANAWALVGTHVTVHNPGGDVVVDLKDDTVWLTGPTVFVARCEVPWH